MKENATLRDKMTTLKNYFVTTESEQQANRDNMIRMINEQCAITRLTDDIDILRQVRVLCRLTTAVPCTVVSSEISGSFRNFILIFPEIC